MVEQTLPSGAAPQRVDCPSSKESTIRLFLAAALCLGFGAYCAYDAFLAKEANGKPKYSPQTNPSSYWFNLVLGVVLPPIGVLALVAGARLLRRRFSADEEGLGYVGGPKVRWSQVTALLPRGKGLLDVEYNLDGRRGAFKLDSLRLTNFTELVKFIEAMAPDVPAGPTE